MNDLIGQITMFLAIYIPVIILVLIITITFGSKVLIRRILDPINSLADAARDYAKISKQPGELKGGIFAKHEVNTGDELEDLWSTMVEMEDEVFDAMEEIKTVTSKQERMAAELDLAKNIQFSALPNKFPAFPDRAEFDIYAYMTPAKEIGGDFYDFFLIDDDHLGIVIADVSGKGVPAALFMMISKTIIKNSTKQGGLPSQIIARTNEILCEDSLSEMFVTVWLGILTISTGEVIACNAGHEYPFITDENGEFIEYREPHGVVCGILKKMEYTDYSFTIPKGGRLFLYTDGVPEAQGEDTDMFGQERLKASLNRNKDLGPKELIMAVKEDVDRFQGKTQQFDDITMVSLTYLGK